MEVFEAIRTLLAVRQYQDRPVPEPVLNRILEAGRLSASAMNKQPWQFVVVQEMETLRQLGAMMRTGPYIAEAPLAIVVVVERNRFAVSDASRAIQDMMLAAWGEGVGSNWVGFGGMEEVKTLLRIPKELDALAIVTFGYPAEPVGKGAKDRRPLAEMVHWQRW